MPTARRARRPAIPPQPRTRSALAAWPRWLRRKSRDIEPCRDRFPPPRRPWPPGGPPDAPRRNPDRRPARPRWSGPDRRRRLPRSTHRPLAARRRRDRSRPHGQSGRSRARTPSTRLRSARHQRDQVGNFGDQDWRLSAIGVTAAATSQSCVPTPGTGTSSPCSKIERLLLDVPDDQLPELLGVAGKVGGIAGLGHRPPVPLPHRLYPAAPPYYRRVARSARTRPEGHAGAGRAAGRGAPCWAGTARRRRL